MTGIIMMTYHDELHQTEDNNCYTMQLRVCRILDWIRGLHACPLMHDLVAFFLCCFERLEDVLTVEARPLPEECTMQSRGFQWRAMDTQRPLHGVHTWCKKSCVKYNMNMPNETLKFVLRQPSPRYWDSLRPHSFAQQVFEIKSRKS